MDYEKKYELIAYMAEVYQKSLKKVKGNPVQGKSLQQEKDRALAALIDRYLEECSEDTRLILRTTFFKNDSE